MCIPAIPLAIAATALTAGGQIVSGINQSNAATYQSRIAAQNAALDQRAANDARDRGAVQEQRQYQRTAQLIGAQRAAQASNGIETGFGSALAIQGDAAQIGAEDAQTIRTNTTNEIKGFEISSANETAKSLAAKSAASGALWSTAFGVGSTILGGASQVNKLKLSQAGM